VFKVQGSAPPLVDDVVSLIEKETQKKRIPACHAKCVGLAQSLVMNQKLNVDTHPFKGTAGRSNVES